MLIWRGKSVFICVIRGKTDIARIGKFLRQTAPLLLLIKKFIEIDILKHKFLAALLRVVIHHDRKLPELFFINHKVPNDFVCRIFSFRDRKAYRFIYQIMLASDTFSPESVKPFVFSLARCKSNSEGVTFFSSNVICGEIILETA